MEEVLNQLEEDERGDVRDGGEQTERVSGFSSDREFRDAIGGEHSGVTDSHVRGPTTAVGEFLGGEHSNSCVRGSTTIGGGYSE